MAVGDSFGSDPEIESGHQELGVDVPSAPASIRERSRESYTPPFLYYIAACIIMAAKKGVVNHRVGCELGVS